MTLSLKRLRREAKEKLRAARAERSDKLSKIRKLSDALHVVAQEAGFESWPKLKAVLEARAMDRDEKAARLEAALFHGQHWMVDALLAEEPELSTANFGLEVALLNLDAVRRAIEFDRGVATRMVGRRSPILHLAFSKHWQVGPDMSWQTTRIAELLLLAGADVNDSFPESTDGDQMYSVLYGALGHAGNMPLARWLLEYGANPNDGESLYHSTELGHHEGLDMLLAHGAVPKGTNALLRAMDFNDHIAVKKLLEAGADPNEGADLNGVATKATALHQCARRLNDAEMAEIILKAGGNPDIRFADITAYAAARVYGNRPVASVIAAYGGSTDMPPELSKLARIADGEVLGQGEWLDPAKLPDELRDMIRAILHIPGTFDHIKRLVQSGAEWDRPDPMGITPVQIAGWEGLPDLVAYFLSLKPDLGHVNGYGGTLLSTIAHGAANARRRDATDHVACAELALKEGVSLPRAMLTDVQDEDMSAFLADWATRYPSQVTD